VLPLTAIQVAEQRDLSAVVHLLVDQNHHPPDVDR
jgi:hypothetical protein